MLVEMFLPQGKRESYKKLLVGKGYTIRIDKVPMQEEYEDAFEGETALIKKIVE